MGQIHLNIFFLLVLFCGEKGRGRPSVGRNADGHARKEISRTRRGQATADISAIGREAEGESHIESRLRHRTMEVDKVEAVGVEDGELHQQVVEAGAEAEIKADAAPSDLEVETEPKGPVLGPRVLGETINYNDDLRAPVEGQVRHTPFLRDKEWRALMLGEPIEQTPDKGEGYKVMTVDEWSSRWKPNPDYQECLACGSMNTREHHFQQTWVLSRKQWDIESLCLDCFKFSWRFYKDPDFKNPRQLELEKWADMMEAAANWVEESTGERPGLYDEDGNRIADAHLDAPAAVPVAAK